MAQCLEGAHGFHYMHSVATGLSVQGSAGKKEDLHALNVLRRCRTFGEESSKIPAMAIPKFLVGDNTDHPENVFIIHTEYPRFVIDLDSDEVEWLDDIDGEDETELTDEMSKLLDEANTFYIREVERYEAMED